MIHKISISTNESLKPPIAHFILSFAAKSDCFSLLVHKLCICISIQNHVPIGVSKRSGNNLKAVDYGRGSDFMGILVGLTFKIMLPVKE